MQGLLKFSMRPKDDLSTRPDFAFDFMSEVSKACREILEDSDALAKLRAKADVRVSATGTLRNVSIKIDVTPKEGVEMSPDDVKAAEEASKKELHGALNGRMSAIMQKALSAARGRM